jgi:hypothetical protein
MGPYTSLSCEHMGPHTSLSCERMGPYTSLSCERMGPHTSLSSERMGPHTSLSSERMGPYTSLSSEAGSEAWVKLGGSESQQVIDIEAAAVQLEKQEVRNLISHRLKWERRSS